MSKFNAFPDYQSLESGSKGSAGKANRSIPDRVSEYGILNVVNKDSTVLDLGCNRGFFGTYLSPHIKHYTGIESDMNNIKHAQVKPNMTIHHQTYANITGMYNVILCLAFHSYVGKHMTEFGGDLVTTLNDGGHLFLEGHPPNYRGEPLDYWNPLTKYLDEFLDRVEEKTVIDRGLHRPFIHYKKK